MLAIVILGAAAAAATPTATVTPAPTRAVVRATTDPNVPGAFSERYGSAGARQLGEGKQSVPVATPTPPGNSMLGLGFRDELYRLTVPGGITRLALVGGKCLNVTSLTRNGQLVHVKLVNGAILAYPLVDVDWGTTLTINPVPTPISVATAAPTPSLDRPPEAQQAPFRTGDKPTFLWGPPYCPTLDVTPIQATQLPDHSWKIQVKVKANVVADFEAQPEVEVILYDDKRHDVGRAKERWPLLRPTEDHTAVVEVQAEANRTVASIEVSVPDGCPGRRAATSQSKHREPEAYATATALYQAFTTSAVAANELYGGKLIAVTGYIAEIDTTWSGTPLIRLYTGYKYERVTCTFDVDQADQLRGYRKGDFIGLTGFCTKGLPVLVAECELY